MQDVARDQVRPRRICFVLESAHRAFDPGPGSGGAERQVRLLGERLADEGHEVRVASRGKIAHERLRWSSSDRLWRTLRAARPERVVSTISTVTAVKAALYCRLLGLPFIYRLSNTGESELRVDRETGGGLVERAVFYLMLRVLATKIWCQHGVQKANLERRGLGGKIFVVANFAPDRRIATDAARDTVLWIGRHDPVKQAHLFPRLARRLPGRRCRMILPGGPAEFRDAWRGISNLEIVDYLPPEELPAIYARGRVLVNTSFTEGMPNTFVEAACQGTPILTTDVDPGGFFERYRHGRVIHDLDELAAGIDELFEDADLFARRSAGARRYFEEVHEIERNFPALRRHLLD